MHATILLTPFLMTLAMLASCTSPPRPPTVDESHRRPVNNVVAVELQACKSDLQDTRILATESGRLAQASAATLASVSAHQQALANLQRRDQPPPQANSLYMIHFDHGSSHIELASDSAATLVEEAKRAPLVLLRGRTDGTSDTPAEARVARDRAAAVKDYLVAAGVDASRIHPTYQSVGDHIAANTDPGGRALNRRVEIEIYHALPSPRLLARPGERRGEGDQHG